MRLRLIRKEREWHRENGMKKDERYENGVGGESTIEEGAGK